MKRNEFVVGSRKSYTGHVSVKTGHCGLTETIPKKLPFALKKS